MQNMKKLPLIALIGSLCACGGSDYGMSGMTGISGTGGSGTTLLTDTGVSPPTAPATPATPGAAAPAESGAFLINLYQDGLAEIQLSQLALQRATSEDVRRFAQRMIDHHTAANNEISQLAQRKGVSLPATPPADFQAQLASLTAVPSDQFDLAYMQANIAAHDKDIAAARLQAQQGADPDVRRLARIALPVLKVHLASAEEVTSLLDPTAFLAIAYRDGLAEIQLSQLALQKTGNDDVREFAQRMIDEHTQVNSRIAALAQQEGAALPPAPSAEQQATAAELSRFTGADFDEAYMDANVIAHVKAVRLFRKQSEQGRDPEVKAFAADTLPDLTAHLTEAVDTDRSVSPTFPFLAFQDGEAEIALSQLALRRASNADVKAFAQRMIDHHTAFNNQLQLQAQAANLTLPAELAPEHLLVLAEMVDRSGQDFDEAYMELNVRVHERDVQAAEAASQQSADALGSTVAQDALPVLNEHLAQARALRDQVRGSSQAQ